MSNTVYTRKISGLDKRVWYVLVAAILLPLGLMAYFLTVKEECVQVKFNARSVLHDTLFITDDAIIFTTLSDPNNFTWDFGDRTGKFYGQTVVHKYKVEGDYFVTTRSGFGCENIQRITVLKLDTAEPDSIPPYYTDKGIIGDSAAVEGETKSFTAVTETDKYSWFMRGNQAEQKGRTVNFTFLRTGITYIDLYLGGDYQKKYTKKIIVDKKPDTVVAQPVGDTTKPQQPQQPQTPTISDAEIEKKYMALLAGVVTGVEYDPNEFYHYLCKGSLTPSTIQRGKKKEAFPLNVSLQLLKGRRTYKRLIGFKTGSRLIRITGVHVHRDNNNCVDLVEISYE